MDRRRSQKRLVEREIPQAGRGVVDKPARCRRGARAREDLAAGIVPQDAVAALVAAALVVAGNLTAAVTGDESSTRQRRSRPVRQLPQGNQFDDLSNVQGMFNSNLSKEVPAAMQPRQAGHQLPADREGSASSASVEWRRRRPAEISDGKLRSPHRAGRQEAAPRVAERPKQKTDVVEHPQVFRHIGFATGEPTSSRPVRSQCSHPTGSMAWVVKR